VEWDRADFAGLVREHGQSVYAYLARRGGHQIADDLFNEVWLRAWRSRHSYDSARSSPRLWLYGIARNTLRAQFRLKTDAGIPVVHLRVDPWPEVDDRLDSGRLKLALEQALGALGEENREVLLLVAWEELSPAEIAVVLDLSQSTVRSRLHRARATLRHHLETDIDLSVSAYPQENRT
jgi:RNA polymerase sigma factor (sigma-70 family)